MTKRPPPPPAPPPRIIQVPPKPVSTKNKTVAQKDITSAVRQNRGTNEPT